MTKSFGPNIRHQPQRILSTSCSRTCEPFHFQLQKSVLGRYIVYQGRNQGVFFGSGLPSPID